MKHSELKKLIKEEIRSVLNEGLFDRFRKKPLPNYKIVREFPLSDLYKNQNELDPLIQTHPDPDYHNFEYLTKNYKKFSGFIPDWSRGLSDDETISAIVFPPDDTIHFIAKKYLAENKLNEGLFKKFTQATIDDVNDDLLKDKFDRVIKADDDSPINYEDRITEYVYDFIKEFSRRYKEGMFGPDPLSKRIDPERNMYREVRNKFKENGNQISVREIGEIVASNYLIKK